MNNMNKIESNIECQNCKECWKEKLTSSFDEQKEFAFQVADRYISIQEASEGYDYTIYDMNYRELDGGIYDNLNLSIHEVLNEIILDLKEPVHQSERGGEIHDYDELIPIDYDDLTARAEYAEMLRFEELAGKKAEECMVVTEFKAKTKEMFHDINGVTPEDIELNIYAYLQSKIDEFEIAIRLVDVAVSGSRCRGLEKTIPILM